MSGSSADGVDLHGWFFPADLDSASRGRCAVCHRTGNISHRLDICSALLETQVAVFLFDYRGFGRSQGRPSEEGTYRDAQAAHRWLQSKGFTPERIIAFGMSLGGGVASELARREKLAGLSCRIPFSSLPALGAELYPWLPVRWVFRIRYDTCSVCRNSSSGAGHQLQPPRRIDRLSPRAKELCLRDRTETVLGVAETTTTLWPDRANFVEGMENFCK
jgi:pimeloyl-ACP methyl ester carboxylesterase